MANKFATRSPQGGDAGNQAPTLPPTQDPYFAGDSIMDPSELGPVHTTLWRKNKGGGMSKMKFAPYKHQEFPKTMYGIDVEHVTVYDEEEEKQAREAGYVDHPTKVRADLKEDVQVEGLQLAGSALAGDTAKDGTAKPKAKAKGKKAAATSGEWR